MQSAIEELYNFYSKDDKKNYYFNKFIPFTTPDMPANLPIEFSREYFALVFAGCKMLYTIGKEESEAILDATDCVCKVAYYGYEVKMIKEGKRMENHRFA